MSWEPARIEAFARRMYARHRFMVSGSARDFLIDATWEWLDRRRPHPDFTVDEWAADGSHRTRIIAGTCDLEVAHAAFALAVKKWPDSILSLRKGAWVIREWPEREI